MSEQNIDAYEYKQKVIDILNSNFGDGYSIEWLDDTHFSLSISEPVVFVRDGKTIIGNARLLRRCILEEHENDPDSACILASVAQRIETETKNGEMPVQNATAEN